MEFEFLQSSKAFRRSQPKRLWSWPRFWLAFSCGGLLIIGTLALLKTIDGSMSVLDPRIQGPPIATYSSPTAQENLPDILRERPGSRPVPAAVNEFLREEQSLNSGRLDLLRQRQVEVEEMEFSAQCLPQWDFRSPKREVIWFYNYRSGATAENHPLTVFGAVDGLGKPLFQHPPMAGDPLALLDSQYIALKWITLDQPRLAIIAGSNGPWPECGAVVDLFLLNNPSSGTAPRFWRFQDKAMAESPPRSAQMIGFRDADGDGFRDLCGFHLEGDLGQQRPVGICYLYEDARGSFADTFSTIAEDVTEALHSAYLQLVAGEKLGELFLLAAPATKRTLKGMPGDEKEPSDEEPFVDESP